MKTPTIILRAWQAAPSSWRTGLAKSRVAPPLRRLMNALYPRGRGIFALAEPLAGYRMWLDWHSSKAFVFGTYEPQVVGALLTVIQQGFTVLDLGAHVGYFALLLAKLVGPEGKVIAFEPHTENFRALHENVQLNRCVNVLLENCAVAEMSGTAILKLNDGEKLTYTASLLHGSEFGSVHAVCIDDYLTRKRERIQFAMMDVEGMEAAVLSGMRSTLQRDHPVLLVELHGFDQFGRSHPALEELRAMGYSVDYLDAPGAQMHILAKPADVPSSPE